MSMWEWRSLNYGMWIVANFIPWFSIFKTFFTSNRGVGLSATTVEVSSCTRRSWCSKERNLQGLGRSKTQVAFSVGIQSCTTLWGGDVGLKWCHMDNVDCASKRISVSFEAQGLLSCNSSFQFINFKTLEVQFLKVSFFLKLHGLLMSYE